MRQFVIIGHDAPVDGEFSLNGLPGEGRLDLLSRCVTAALLLSHDIREDVTVHLILGDEVTIRFEGSSLRGLHPDERSTAALIRTALEQREEAIGHIPVETSPGVFLQRFGIEETIEQLAGEGTVCQLREDGKPITTVDPPANPIFVLSDHQDFRAFETELLAEHCEYQLSLGPTVLHADHAITVANHWMDTDGYSDM